jgi:hypothetical protein
MGTPAVRSVVLVTFPFSDLSANASLITGSVGELSEPSQRAIIERVVSLFRR